MRKVMAWVLVTSIFLAMFSQQASQAQSDYLDLLDQQVEQLFRQGKYPGAVAIAQRGLALAEKKSGPNHPDVGEWLNNLAVLYLSQGRYADAEPLFQRSHAIIEKALGQDHPDVGTSLNNLAGLYETQGRYAEAEPLYKRSHAIREKALEPDHPDVGTSLNNLAGLYQNQGRYADAEPLYKRALSIVEKSLGPAHPNVGTSLNNLAELYRDQGRYADAEPIYKRSLAIREKVLGSDHPDVAQSLSNVAALYQDQGRNDGAEPLYKRSLAIREKALGTGHPDVANSLSNLALLYQVQGRYAQAEPLHKRSFAIREETFGPNHPDVANSLNNLAELYRDQGRYTEAEPLYKRSLSIIEKALEPDHPLVATALGNVAGLYRDQGRYAEAEPLYKRSLTIREKALGTGHPDVANSLSNLALLYQDQGHYRDAEPLHKRSLTIREKALGTGHPEVANSLINLAALYRTQGDWVGSVDYFRRGSTVIQRRARRQAQIVGRALTGIQQSEATRSKRVFSDFIKSADRLALQQPASRDRLAGEMFEIAQWSSGSEAAASLAKMAARQATGNGELGRLVRERQDLVGEWQTRDARRSSAVALAPDKRNPTQEAENVARLDKIDQRIVLIDKRLALEFPEYAALANPEPLSIAKVQEQITENEALVLFLDTREEKPTPEETFIWVVTKTSSRWMRSDLGPNALRDRVDALRCGLDYDGSWTGSRCFDLLNVVYSDQDRLAGTPLPFSLSRAHALYRSLFSGVEDLIKGKDLLIIPSGPLTQLPFQVLVTEKPAQDLPLREAFRKAAWLAKKHAVTVLPSVASLAALRLHAKASTATKPFIGIGNPLLDGNVLDQQQQAAAKLARSIKGCTGAEVTRTAQLRAPRSRILPLAGSTVLTDLRALRAAAPLPETADELCAVGRSAGAGKDDIYLGQTATEAGIKTRSENGTLAKYKVIHFATHGALAGELKGANEPGLILTPPETVSPRDDGYLSASEIVGLKLNADLVILSACNTAGGDAKNAEALSGLARAFFYAGARSLFVSHWYVDSQATVALITKAFDALKRHPDIGRAEALRTAMVALIEEGERTWHPAFWAPFVVVGEGSAVAALANSSASSAPNISRFEFMPEEWAPALTANRLIPGSAAPKTNGPAANTGPYTVPIPTFLMRQRPGKPVASTLPIKTPLTTRPREKLDEQRARPAADWREQFLQK